MFTENINDWIYIAFVPEALAQIAKSNEDKIIFLVSSKLHTFGTKLFLSAPSLTRFSSSDASEWVRNAREEVTVSSSKLRRRRISCQS